MKTVTRNLPIRCPADQPTEPRTNGVFTAKTQRGHRWAAAAVIIAIVIAVVAGALLHTPPHAEAQTAGVLVRNTGQTHSPYAAELDSSVPSEAQPFTTGANPAGYQIHSIAFYFETISDTSSVGDQLQVDIYDESDGDPNSSLCTMDDPGTFSAPGLNVFTAPTTGTTCPTLTPGTTYYAVITRVAFDSNTISSPFILSTSIDADSALGWSISNSLYFDTTADNWIPTNPKIIEVKGYAATQLTVPGDWTLTPAGLSPSDKFHLLFATSGTRDASSTDIDDYNSFVATAATAGHADIQQYGAWFKAVGSTADVDARDNTSTRYASASKGVPIYWLVLQSRLPLIG